MMAGYKIKPQISIPFTFVGQGMQNL